MQESGMPAAAAPNLGRGPQNRRLRILMSEGASTSAREAVTALGLKGHRIEICDPDAHCLGRFSRFVARFHRSPGIGQDPEGYLAFVLDLISRRRFDVLLPIHEQGFLFARVKERITPHVAVALPSFDSYDQVHSKAGFSRLLSEIGLPQPTTRFAASAAELRSAGDFPLVIKTSVGTASRGVWMVRGRADLEQAVRELDESGGFEGEVLVQDLAPGVTEHAQAVFSDGELVGMHAFRQLAKGAGGGAALKVSVRRPLVRNDLARLGARLRWHGALSVDYIVGNGGDPLYVDCNPRLVEPMSAVFAGVDLMDLLVRISLGDPPPFVQESNGGVRTHMALQSLLGCAQRGGSRRDLAVECWRLMAKSGPYAGSLEELTPARLDPPSVVPLIGAALWLLANPSSAHELPKRGWGAQLLTRESIRVIRELASADPGKR